MHDLLAVIFHDVVPLQDLRRTPTWLISASTYLDIPCVSSPCSGEAQRAPIVGDTGDIYQQGVGSKPRSLRDTWIELDCTGDVHAIGEHCIGHREVVRLDGTKVAARAPIATPKFSDEAHRRVPTSACLTDGGLLVIERRERIPDTIEETTAYRRFVRDPLTLRELGAAQEFEELSSVSSWS